MQNYNEITLFYGRTNAENTEYRINGIVSKPSEQVSA